MHTQFLSRIKAATPASSRVAIERSRLFAENDLPHLEHVGRSALSRNGTPNAQPSLSDALETSRDVRRFALRLASFIHIDRQPDHQPPFRETWLTRSAG